MSAKAIREAKGKQLLSKHLSSVIQPIQLATFDSSSSWDDLVSTHSWLSTHKLVVKPDQLIKRRGKLGLIKVNVDLNEVKKWVSERIDKEVQVIFYLNRIKKFSLLNSILDR